MKSVTNPCSQQDVISAFPRKREERKDNLDYPAPPIPNDVPDIVINVAFPNIQPTLDHSPTYALGHDAAPVRGVDHPVVVDKRVHGLEYRADTSDVVVNLSIADKLGRYVRIEFPLNLSEEGHLLWIIKR